MFFDSCEGREFQLFVIPCRPIFGSVFNFGFRTLKLRFFGFGVLRGLRVFSNLVFGFRYFCQQ